MTCEDQISVDMEWTNKAYEVMHKRTVVF